MHSQLTQKQRCQMEALVSTGAKQAVIAAILGVRPSTVCRELARNRAKGRRGHCAKGARKQADGRRRKPARRISEAMCSEVVRLMRERDWSPQMISERLRKERGVKVSHEWICQMLLENQASGGTLHKVLPFAGKRRKRRGVPETRGRIPDRVSINERPAEANERSELGHWEADTFFADPYSSWQRGTNEWLNH